MRVNSVKFAVARQAAWAPGLSDVSDWAAWAGAEQPAPIVAAGPGVAEAPVPQLPPLLRRRAGALGKMALQAAFSCLGDLESIPAVFCSRHGELVRAVELISALVQGEGVSPTGFGLSVHNASAGLLSIARGERASHFALAAGAATVEHGVIEACGLLADGAPMVLLVVYDAPLPAPLRHFQDCEEQPFAFAWAMVAADADADADPIELAWQASRHDVAPPAGPTQPGGLEALRFQLSGAMRMQREAQQRCWTWSRGA